MNEPDSYFLQKVKAEQNSTLGIAPILFSANVRRVSSAVGPGELRREGEVLVPHVPAGVHDIHQVGNKKLST
jgi:hypothetical protein